MEPVLITELQDDPVPPSHMQLATLKDNSEHNTATMMEFEFDEEEKSNQIFNVKDAVPPNDFDAPYSQLPGGNADLGQMVKQMVKKVYLGLAEEKGKEKAKMMAKVKEKAA